MNLIRSLSFTAILVFSFKKTFLLQHDEVMSAEKHCISSHTMSTGENVSCDKDQVFQCGHLMTN